MESGNGGWEQLDFLVRLQCHGGEMRAPNSSRVRKGLDCSGHDWCKRGMVHAAPHNGQGKQRFGFVVCFFFLIPGLLI